MKRHIYVFLHGLVVVAPIAITVYVIYACVSWIDGGMRKLLGDVSPGVGFLSIIILIYLVGLAARYWFLDVLVGALNRLLERIPVVKLIYDAVKDLLKFFVEGGKQKGEVVKVPVGDGKAHMLGIVMQSTDKKEPLPVYLPMSYNMGGFLVYLPRENIEKVDMDAGTALKLVLTAGVGTPQQK